MAKKRGCGSRGTLRKKNFKRFFTKKKERNARWMREIKIRRQKMLKIPKNAIVERKIIIKNASNELFTRYVYVTILDKTYCIREKKIITRVALKPFLLKKGTHKKSNRFLYRKRKERKGYFVKI